jgi:ABC-type Zn uptake system ZnuABC Zn-binding protein ZnuA
MGRRKKPVQSEAAELAELEEAANQEHDRRCAEIDRDYPEDHHATLRTDLMAQAATDITREFTEQYPVWAKVYGPKPPKSIQFKKVQGNIGLDIGAKKYD